MRRDFVIDRIRDIKKDFAQRFGVAKIGIFGSVARDQAREDSDVDIVVEMEKPDLFHMVHMKDELEMILNSPVDIVRYREKMNRYLKARIDKEAFYV